jgi:hypothetical protein
VTGEISTIVVGRENNIVENVDKHVMTIVDRTVVVDVDITRRCIVDPQFAGDIFKRLAVVV